MVKAEFRLLAPLRVGFARTVGIADRQPDGERSFWQRAEKALDDPRLTVHAADTKTVTFSYTKAARDALPTPLEVISGCVDPDEVADLLPAGIDCAEISWDLLDHGVALVECRLSMLLDAKSPERARASAENGEEALQEAAEKLVRHVLEGHLNPLIAQLQTIPGAADHLSVGTSAGDEALWVARALLLDRRDEEQVEFCRAWLAGTDGHVGGLVDELCAGSRVNVTRWLNYAYRTDVDSSEQWLALRRAQYFYAAMGQVDDSLRTIVAWTMAERSSVSLSGLRRSLTEAMNRAQALLMLKAEVGKYASRSCRAEMADILQEWDFEEVLHEPVRDKLEVCQQRLDALGAERAAKSAVFTDVILMAIGVTTILSTALALVQFGRDSASDPNQSQLDLGYGSLTSWFSSQPIDAIVLISTLASLLLVVVFVMARRNSVS